MGRKESVCDEVQASMDTDLLQSSSEEDPSDPWIDHNQTPECNEAALEVDQRKNMRKSGAVGKSTKPVLKQSSAPLQAMNVPVRKKDGILTKGHLLPTLSANGGTVSWTCVPSVADWFAGLIIGSANLPNAEKSETMDSIGVDGVDLAKLAPAPNLGSDVDADAQLVPPSARFEIPRRWDFRFILHADSRSVKCLKTVGHLATKFELIVDQLMSRNEEVDWLQEKYRSIQDYLREMFQRICADRSIPFDDPNRRQQLDCLYRTTACHLESLVDEAKGGSKNRPESFRPTQPAPVAPARSPQKKKEHMQQFMSAWLRANWTNPYPDEPCLRELATECGATPAVVSNWLINARTRKWRPAIVAAAELRRPSAMLLEDSIRIFDGHPVQDISSPSEDVPQSTCFHEPEARAQVTTAVSNDKMSFDDLHFSSSSSSSFLYEPEESYFDPYPLSMLSNNSGSLGPDLQHWDNLDSLHGDSVCVDRPAKKRVKTSA
jgi:Homeobox KN domain